MGYINHFTDKKIDVGSSSAELNGSKGHKLIQMKAAGFNVPSGLVITTTACNTYRSLPENVKTVFLNELMEEVKSSMKHIVKGAKTKLISVRSGAPVSMPGMMDTILNVGAGYPKSGLPTKGHLRTNCRKRFTEMFLSVVHGIKKEDFEPMLHEPLDVVTLVKIVKKRYPDINDVIHASIKAVFDSWNTPRAIHYRKINNISDDLGTAVIIQSMVFGNYNDKSGSGVMFTCNPNTGEPEVFGNFLVNAQGEDVVSGEFDAPDLADMEGWNHKIYDQVVTVGQNLEYMFNDPQDIEFTVEDGKLFILQTRNAMRSAEAEVVVALNYLEKGAIKSLSEKIKRGSITKLRSPVLPEGVNSLKYVSGIPSGGSIATGRVATSVKSVLSSTEPVILVAQETTPNDIAAMDKAVGIVTVTGSLTCHAAVVSRGMNKTCVVGCTDIDLPNLPEQNYMLVDGKTGIVYLSAKPFDVDLDPSLNVGLISRLLEGVDTSLHTVGVKNAKEATDFEEYLYKIAVPSSSLKEFTVGPILEYLSDTFDSVIIQNHLRKDAIADFIGEPILQNVNVVTEVEGCIVDGLDNVYLDMQDSKDRDGVLPEFKTLADLMNPDFYGVITSDFINKVVGDQDTFDQIREQLGLDKRLINYIDLLDMIEVELNIG